MTTTAGTFTASRTRDAIALDHDGQTFTAANHIGDDPRDGRLFEILFADGEWVLASEHDLTWTA